jgi:hypothetical protein
MSDPLSATASVITVLELAKAVQSYLLAVKDAPKECKKLLLDISYIHGLLDILHGTMIEVDNAADWAGTTRVLARSDSPIANIKALLEPLEAKLKKQAGRSGVAKFTGYIIWPLSKSQTEAVLQAVKRQQDLLMIALDNDHLLLSTKIKSDIAVVKSGVVAMSTSVKDLQTTIKDSKYGKVIYPVREAR